MKVLNFIKKKDLTFIFLNIYIFLMIVLPKDFNSLLGVIPIRTCLTYMLFGIFMLEKYVKKINFKKTDIKLFTIFYILFLLSTIPSIIVSKNIITSIYTLIKFISYYLLIFVLIKYPFKKDNFKTIIKNIIIASSLVTIYGIIQYIFEFDLNLNGVEKYPGIKGRIPSTFFNPIYYGVFVNIIFIYIITFIKNNLFNKKLLYILSILLYSALVLTFTRSAILVFFGILFLTFLFNYKLILNKITISLLVIFIALTLLIPGAKYVSLNSFANGFDMLFGSNFMTNLLFKNDSDKTAVKEDASIEHRKEFSIIATRIANNNPLTGVGFGTYINYMDSKDFSKKYSDYKLSHTHPHAGFILLLAETGYIATLLFIFSYSILIYQFIKDFINRFKRKDFDYCISVNLITCLIGFIITCIMAENLFYDTQIFSIFLFVIILTFNYLNKEKRLAK